MKTLDQHIAAARAQSSKAPGKVIPVFFGTHSDADGAIDARRLVARVQREYMEAWEQGLAYGKLIGRAATIQAILATSAMWLAVFCIALVMLP